MKRFDPKNKYFGWGITAFGVIACSILFFMLLQHGKSISGAIGTLISILSPIIWGMVITYLLWPLVKMFQRKLFEPLLQKIRPKKPVSKSLARGLSVVLAILVALVLIAALVWLIIPQLYTSIESIVLNSPYPRIPASTACPIWQERRLVCRQHPQHSIFYRVRKKA